MRTGQLEKFLNDDSVLNGTPVLPFDYWSVNIGTAIVNTDVSSQPGKHWIAIYKKHKHIYYFDSSGKSPLTRGFDFEGYPFSYNEERWQPKGSMNCGLYCLWYL